MPPKDRYEYFEGEDLARDKESGIIYAIKHFSGMPPLYKSTRTKDKRKAKKMLPDLMRAHLERYGDGKLQSGESPTIGQVIDEIYATDKDRKPLRPKTRSKRKFYFDRIRSEMELEYLPIDKLDETVWTARLDKVRKIRKRKTFKDYVKHVNIIIKYAYRRKYLSHYITFPNPDGAHKVGIVFTTEELEQMFGEMSEDTKDQFVLSYENCMRKLEALHLEWSRVNLETGEVVFQKEHVKTGSKTGKGRTIILNPHGLERLRARHARQEKAGLSRWVFPSDTGKGPINDNKTAWNYTKERVLKKNPAFQHWGVWHHLRHTAITRMLLVYKIPIALVSEFVGTSIDTLQRTYLHSQAEHTRGITDHLMVGGGK